MREQVVTKYDAAWEEFARVVRNYSFMPRRRRALGGRPELRRLPARGSRIIWQAARQALKEHGKPAACLAGSAGGVTRSARTIRQDLANKSVLKVEAAWFLVQRLFEEHLIEPEDLLRLEAVLKLSGAGSTVQCSTDKFGRVIPGRLFLSANLDDEITTAIATAWPSLRGAARQAIATAVER